MNDQYYNMMTNDKNDAHDSGEQIKFVIKNPLPFLVGDLHSHVDRLLRDKGMMNKEISEAIMSFTQSDFLDNSLSKIKQQEKEESQDEQIREIVAIMVEHLTTPTIGFETVKSKFTIQRK